MEISPHTRTPETDELLRRIGRNVLNFQIVEHLLKRLAVLSVPKGPVSKMVGRTAQHAAVVNVSTMGVLAGKVMDTVLQSSVEKPTPNDIDEPWIGFRFSIEADAEFVDRHDREMQVLVKARNELVHQFLPHWHASVGGDTASVMDYLEMQNMEILRMQERLRTWVENTKEALRQHTEYLVSPEFEIELELSFLRNSRLVALLGEIAQRTARADGWAFFTTAANLIQREAPNELLNLEKRFGLKTLKALLLATGLFDVADEPLPKGGVGVRTIYRINSRYELERS